MDFLDSLDLETTHRKSHRVRSWYLYEQFKSLERNQLDAAQKLKDKSYQERLLRQELSERRARRKLYDQFGLTQSESRIDRSIRSDGTRSHLDVEDSFESFCELQDERSSHATEHDTSEDTFSMDDSVIAKSYTDDFKSIEGSKYGNNYAGSVDSVVENLKTDENEVDEAEEKFEITNRNIAEDLNFQLESVKDDIRCIEEFAQMTAVDKISEDESVVLTEERELVIAAKRRHVNEQDHNLFTVWTKLVSFAYQVVKLNHGNCYYDYSSQFLTAVLICDILRKGVNKMCHILQPYVSPIKYATDESDVSVTSYKNVKRKKTYKSKKSSKIFELHPNSKAIAVKKRQTFNKNYHSEDYWPRRHKHSSQNDQAKCSRRASEPWHRIRKFPITNEKASCSSSIWPEFSRKLDDKLSMQVCGCCYGRKVRNPMTKIAQYIDSVLNENDFHYNR